MALELDCPACGTAMRAEHAHAICPACRFIHPCCDGAPQPAPRRTEPEAPACPRS